MSDQGHGGAAPSWRDITVRPYHRRRDWRWWVGGIGRVLVAAGLLLLVFVGYQLWGTGIQTRQAQNRLEQQFDDVVAATPTTTTTARPPRPRPARPGTTTTAPPTTPAPPPRPCRRAEGDPVARLQTPPIGLDWIVVSGVGVDDLKKGPGHYPDTPLPGQNGNVAIAGHRTTYGAPFFRIDELAVGDDIVLTALDGRQFTYKVTDQFIVPPSQTEVLAPSDTPILTLTSCHPELLGQEADHRPGRLGPQPVRAARRGPAVDDAADRAPDRCRAPGDPARRRGRDHGGADGNRVGRLARDHRAGRDRRSARAATGMVRRSRRLAAGARCGASPSPASRWWRGA